MQTTSPSSFTAFCSAASLALALALALALGASVAAAAAPAPDDAAAWNAASVSRGRVLYRALCAGCHGRSGRGDGPAAAALFPPPRDLTRADYRFRSTATGALPLPSDLLRTLRDGLPGTPMPAWGGQLDDVELRSLVLYLETLSPRFAAEPPSDDDVVFDPSRLHPPPVSDELVARGAALYRELGCAKCHGERGRGDGPAAPTLRNPDGTRAHVFDFTYGVYKGGSRPEDVYRTLMTGLVGTPMPSFADSLPEERDRWALVYFVRSLRTPKGLWFYLTERPTWQDPLRWRLAPAEAHENAPAERAPSGGDWGW